MVSGVKQQGRVKQKAKQVAKAPEQRRVVVIMTLVICMDIVQHTGGCIVAVVKQTTSKQCAGAKMVEREQCMI